MDHDNEYRDVVLNNDINMSLIQYMYCSTLVSPLCIIPPSQAKPKIFKTIFSEYFISLLL